MTTRTRHYRYVLAMLCTFATVLGGCDGGDGSFMDPSPVPSPGDQPIDANFSEIQANVFTPTCATAGCHEGAGAPQGLRLDEANSYGLLVNQTSSEDPAVLRVAPHDPDGSYLIRKIEGTASVGDAMPLGGPMLDTSVIGIIRQWITDGAIDDRSQSAGTIRVTSLSPLPETELTASPMKITAIFDRELDVSTVNAMTFIVESSGGDGTFTDGNEIPVNPDQITAPTIAPMSATLELGNTRLADDIYRVRLLGSSGSIILDLDTNALDGEFAGTFPSGDGAAGGDFEATFSVVTTQVGPGVDQ